MKVILAACLALILTATTLQAASLDTPKLSDPIDTFAPDTSRFFNENRFLTTGGMKYSTGKDFALEPELGVGYHATDWEVHGGMEQLTHRLHAQAGGRLSLSDTLYLSAAAKLPMLTVERTGQYTGEEIGTRPDLNARQGYNFTSPIRNTLWTAEVGIHLSPRTDFTLYYDQSPTAGWYLNGLNQEERIGTRFILRFK